MKTVIHHRISVEMKKDNKSKMSNTEVCTQWMPEC